MSNRVDKITYFKNDNESMDELLGKVSLQLRLLLSSGYNCFISRDVTKNDEKSITIEFCLSDPDLKHPEIPQPCWLMLDELQFLSSYQLSRILDEAKQTVVEVEKELNDEPPEPKKKKKKEPKFDA